MRKVLWMTGYICQCLQYAYAGDIYVAPSGNDLDAGTPAQPKATMAAALRQARGWGRLQDPAVKGGIVRVSLQLR